MPDGSRVRHSRRKPSGGRAPVRRTSIKARKARRKTARRRVSRKIQRKVFGGTRHKVVHRGKVVRNRRRTKPTLFVVSGAAGGGALLALANGRIFTAGLLGGVALGALGLHFGWSAYQKRRGR